MLAGPGVVGCFGRFKKVRGTRIEAHVGLAYYLCRYMYMMGWGGLHTAPGKGGRIVLLQLFLNLCCVDSQKIFIVTGPW